MALNEQDFFIDYQGDNDTKSEILEIMDEIENYKRNISNIDKNEYKISDNDTIFQLSNLTELNLRNITEKYKDNEVIEKLDVVVTFLKQKMSSSSILSKSEQSDNVKIKTDENMKIETEIDSTKPNYNKTENNYQMSLKNGTFDPLKLEKTNKTIDKIVDIQNTTEVPKQQNSIKIFFRTNTDSPYCGK